MIDYFIVPGLGNSGPDHWQTYFEGIGGNFRRIDQKEWDAPNCIDWIETIEKSITGYDPGNVVLIAHSLGCTAVAQWANQYKKIIKGALLVAPSDIESVQYKFPVQGFTPIPREKINFRTIVVASSNDQWVTLERAMYFSDNWGSEFINIGEAGHVNSASGHYKWDDGLTILSMLD
jgi:hypothetical protein